MIRDKGKVIAETNVVEELSKIEDLVLHVTEESSKLDRAWILDTTCTWHMSGRREFFQIIKNFKELLGWEMICLARL